MFESMVFSMKQRNPNSYNSARRNSSKSWSELPQDLLNAVLERLGFAESRRAESVCTSWYSAARRCVAKKQIPWLILFPEEGDRLNNHWCTLFNPEEKGKLYKFRDEGFEFAYSYCLATYGHWLFMGDHWYNFYILNLFTRERIDLPHVESQLGTTKLERNRKGMFCFSNGDQQRTYQGVTIQSPVFWIDEQTKDYIVIWGFGEWCVVYSKKGDHFWNQIQIPKVSYETNMVYKDHKLYYIMHDYFGTSGFIKIFDFSREIPQEIFQCPVPATGSSILLPTINSWEFRASKLVVTVTGDVLKVEKWVKEVSPVNILFSFRVYNVFNNYEKVDSLGHEAMLFDLGITVLANDDDDIVGFKRNSIYFNVVLHDKNNTTQICLFNLETQKMEPLYKFDCSSGRQLAKARWFLPSFKQT